MQACGRVGNLSRYINPRGSAQAGSIHVGCNWPQAATGPGKAAAVADPMLGVP
jgi:hypothetical protein